MAGLSDIKKNITIKGQPHKLAYITSPEADLLRMLGGSGQKVNGIPAYFGDEDEDFDDQGWDDYDAAVGDEASFEESGIYTDEEFGVAASDAEKAAHAQTERGGAKEEESGIPSEDFFGFTDKSPSLSWSAKDGYSISNRGGLNAMSAVEQNAFLDSVYGAYQNPESQIGYNDLVNMDFFDAVDKADAKGRDEDAQALMEHAASQGKTVTVSIDPDGTYNYSGPDARSVAASEMGKGLSALTKQFGKGVAGLVMGWQLPDYIVTTIINEALSLAPEDKLPTMLGKIKEKVFGEEEKEGITKTSLTGPAITGPAIEKETEWAEHLTDPEKAALARDTVATADSAAWDTTQEEMNVALPSVSPVDEQFSDSEQDVPRPITSEPQEAAVAPQGKPPTAKRIFENKIASRQSPGAFESPSIPPFLPTNNTSWQDAVDYRRQLVAGLPAYNYDTGDSNYNLAQLKAIYPSFSDNYLKSMLA